MSVETGREIVATPPLPGAAPYPIMVVRRIVTAVSAANGTDLPPRNTPQQSTSSNGRGRVVDLLV